jgi:Family of unknown function (DUF5681)
MADESADGGGVGYKRPPKHTKFRPGQSGNPAGGRKRGRSLTTDFLEELSELVRVREGDRELKITKQRAFVKSLVAAAIDGDMRATTALVSFCSRAFAREPEKDAEAQSPTPDDLEILAEFVRREVRRTAARVGNDGASLLQSTDRKAHEE